MHKPSGLLPCEDLISQLIDTFVPFATIYTPILDAGGLNSWTSDVTEFIECWTSYWPGRAQIIVDNNQDEFVDDWPKRLPQPLQIDRRDWRYDEVSLVHFRFERCRYSTIYT